MHMMARWKDNFMNFNLEGVFSTCYVLEEKEKLWKMRQRQKNDIEVGDDDMTKDGNHGLMIIRRS
jgi:hypothetical protein